MTFMRRLGTVTSNILVGIRLGIVGLAIAACRGEKERAPASPTVAPPTPAQDSMAATTDAVHWDSAAGGALLVTAEGVGDSALIVRPEYADTDYDGWDPDDLRPLVHSRWDLFGRSGFMGTAQLNPILKAAPEDGCITWPPATMSVTKSGWRLGLESGRATAVPLDSVEAMSRDDSARFVVDVTKLAASTHGSSDSLFSSIPFVVRDAYRFRTGDIEAIIASIQRSILSEANPREEHLFLVAERPIGSSDAYRVVYTTRSAGAERGVAITDVLAAVTVSANHRVALIASHEYDDGGEIWWIERVAPGTWRATWRSATIGCD